MKNLESIKLIDAVIQKSPDSIVVEAGHVYANEEVIDEEVSMGVEVAVEFLGLLQSFWGVQPERLLFVDDLVTSSEGSNYSQEEVTSFVSNVLRLMAMMDFVPDKVVHESWLIDDGLMVIQSLQEGQKTKVHRDRLMFKKGWFPLMGKGGQKDIPACAVLDAVLYQRKLTDFGGAITVLPKKYQDQQGKTKKILTALQEEGEIGDLNILVVYFNEQQSLSFDYWGEYD